MADGTAVNAATAGTRGTAPHASRVLLITGIFRGGLGRGSGQGVAAVHTELRGIGIADIIRVETGTILIHADNLLAVEDVKPPLSFYAAVGTFASLCRHFPKSRKLQKNARCDVGHSKNTILCRENKRISA